MPNNINKNQLIDSSQAKEIAKIYGTPAYVYSENLIKAIIISIYSAITQKISVNFII